jgi:Uma2 family endonuclease
MSFLPIRHTTSVALCSGDRMSREEFHRLYENAPEDLKAELVKGVVYVASPPNPAHDAAHAWLSAILLAYQTATPGVELFDNATLLLDEHSEPQPDLFLRIDPDSGGCSGNSADGYVEGPPELIVEIAQSAKAIDLHYKRQDYSRCGVPEYLVYILDEQRLRWFHPKEARERRPAGDGIYRIKQFPGLWIDERALVAQDRAGLIAGLQRGLSTVGHLEFVEHLINARA